MPYRRSYKSKSKRSYRKKGLTNTQKYEVKKLIGSERLFHDTAINTVSPSTAGATVALSDVPDSGREGSKIQGVYLSGRLCVIAADTHNFIRFIVYKWVPDTTPNINSVLDATQVSAGLGIEAPYDNSNAGLYSVLFDKVVYVDTDDPAKFFKMFIKKSVSGKMLAFGSSSVTTGQNKFYISMISDSGAVSHPVVSGVFRYCYTDA